MASRFEKSGGLVSMFDVARPALAASGLVVGSTWTDTQRQTLGQARAQLARRRIREATAAKWAKAAHIVGAGVSTYPHLDPRPTAYHGPRR